MVYKAWQARSTRSSIDRIICMLNTVNRRFLQHLHHHFNIIAIQVHRFCQSFCDIMAGVQQQSCLLNIPQDVVEIILPHLMPVVKGDKSGPSLSLQQSFANTTSLRSRGRSEPVDWKDTCSALRLTCHALANQKTINRTLFHTIYLYPSPFSLDGLAELSMSPLATLVRRLVLMHPQF